METSRESAQTEEVQDDAIVETFSNDETMSVFTKTNQSIFYKFNECIQNFIKDKIISISVLKDHGQFLI